MTHLMIPFDNTLSIKRIFLNIGVKIRVKKFGKTVCFGIYIVCQKCVFCQKRGRSSKIPEKSPNSYDFV